MKSLKSKLILSCTALFVVSAIIPWIIDEWTAMDLKMLDSIVSLIGVFGSLLTLLVAILLYDRFGVQAKKKEQEIEKVMKLINLLRYQLFLANANMKPTYMLRARSGQLKAFSSAPNFSEDKMKYIAVKIEDYQEFINPIQEVLQDYYLPEEFRTASEFLIIKVVSKDLKPNVIKSDFVTVEFGTKKTGSWVSPIPHITFEDFIVNVESLTKRLEDWVKEKADLSIKVVN